MMDKLKKLFNKNHVPATISKEKTTDAKAEATKKKEPYVAVLNVEMKKDNPRNGFFELDWNEYFVRDLRLNGYQGSSEEEIVDAWFNQVCKNVALSTWEQYGTEGRSGFVRTTDLGDGRKEVK